MHLPESARKILETYQEHGYEAFVVGGCVRDACLGRECKDYDIAVSARPEQTMALFERCIPTGLKHGTLTVLMDGDPYEVTAFRAEGSYSDHRHPDSITFVSSIEEDLARRDFTINAMAWNASRGLVDPFGGLKDLQNGLIRCVGDARIRFSEDALRMLRAFRFAARYGFSIEEKTMNAINENAAAVKDVAAQRVLKELEPVLQSDPQQLEHMGKLLEPWVEEWQICLDTPQNSKWHYTDVGHHTIDALKYALPMASKRAAWALFLHDLGKPAAKTTTEDGVDHFKKHSLYSAKIARRILKTFGFSKKESETIAQIVLHHDDHLKPTLKTLYKYRIAMDWSDEMMEDFLAVQYGDILAHSNMGRDRMAEWKAFKDFYEENKANRPFAIKDLAVDGKDIQDELHLEGRQIGDALNRALEYAFYHPDKNTRDDLLAFLRAGKRRAA